ncbi:MAG TPA: hypothetical protein VJ623_06400 [Holophagaceae bacterium]|nr:hypothetical protein [Holophagaceae bacterium]
MNRSILILLGAALPLAAQTFDAQVFLARQNYNTFNRSGVEAKPDAKTVAALRFEAAFFPGAHQLTVGLGWQPKTKTKVDLSITGSYVGSGDLEHDFWGLSVGYRYVGAFEAGVALDYRGDKLTDGSDSTNYGRPWLRGHVGWAPSKPGWRPVFGLELATPLATTNDDIESAEAVLKSLAPSFQAGLYVGVRF